MQKADDLGRTLAGHAQFPPDVRDRRSCGLRAQAQYSTVGKSALVKPGVRHGPVQSALIADPGAAQGRSEADRTLAPRHRVGAPQALRGEEMSHDQNVSRLSTTLTIGTGRPHTAIVRPSLGSIIQILRQTPYPLGPHGVPSNSGVGTGKKRLLRPMGLVALTVVVLLAAGCGASSSPSPRNDEPGQPKASVEHLRGSGGEGSVDDQ